MQFRLGPQVGNEHTGDFQCAPLTGKPVRNWKTEISVVRKIKLSIEEEELWLMEVTLFDTSDAGVFAGFSIR